MLLHTAGYVTWWAAQAALATTPAPSPEANPRELLAAPTPSPARVAAPLIAPALAPAPMAPFARPAFSPAALAIQTTQAASAIPVAAWHSFDPWFPRSERAAAHSIANVSTSTDAEPSTMVELIPPRFGQSSELDDSKLLPSAGADITPPVVVTFTDNFGALFASRLSAQNNRHLRAVLDYAWKLPSTPDEPARDYVLTGSIDQDYRNQLLEARGKDSIKNTATAALAETDIAEYLRRELVEGNDPVSFGARTMLGESTEGSGPFGIGRLGFRGYLNTWREPADLFGVTYAVGPFDSRIGGATTSASIATQIGDIRASIGGRIRYADGDMNPIAIFTKPLGKSTALTLYVGYGVDSFLIPGNTRFIEDPRDGRSVGAMLLLDARF